MGKNTRHHYTSANPSEDSSKRIEVEESGSGVGPSAISDTYVGLSGPGVSTGAECWKIFRVREDGGLTSLTYPSGSNAFVHVWDNRRDLPYLSGSL